MTGVVKVGDKSVEMRASALIPKLYRYHFGRDIVVDLTELQKNYKKVKETRGTDAEESLSIADLEVFENVAWLMARQANKDAIPDTPDEWLDSIEGVFDIYQALPQILQLWNLNSATTSHPAKK